MKGAILHKYQIAGPGTGGVDQDVYKRQLEDYARRQKRLEELIAQQRQLQQNWPHQP